MQIGLSQALAPAAHALRLGDGRLFALVCHEGAALTGAEPERRPRAAKEPVARLLISLYLGDPFPDDGAGMVRLLDAHCNHDRQTGQEP